MRQPTGMEVGGVTPVGLPEGLPLYVDERLRGEEWLILGAGRRDAKIEAGPEIFPALGGEFVADLGRPLD